MTDTPRPTPVTWTSQRCREVLASSPSALRFLELARSPTATGQADCHGQADMMVFAASIDPARSCAGPHPSSKVPRPLTRARLAVALMSYITDEGREPDFSRFRCYP